MKNINPTQTQAWKALEAHFAANKERQLKDLFAADAERFNKFSTTFGGDMLVDYSKNLITQETMALLQDLAKETDPPATQACLQKGASRACCHP